MAPRKRRSIAGKLWRYVVDSSSMINIQRKNGIVALKRRKGSIVLPRKVAEEVAFDPRVLKSDPIKRFVEENPDIVVDFKDPEEEEEYLRLLGQTGIDEGEAAAMAICLKRNLPLVIDEKQTKARGKAENHGIRTLNSDEFLKSE